MATMNVYGADDLTQLIRRTEKLADDEELAEMLNAGAEVVAEEWRAGINRTIRTNRSKGDLAESVQPSRKIESSGGVSSTIIYPLGKDRKGIRNAEKAFILHYGKSGQPATRFVDAVEDNSEAKAIEAMAEKANEILEKEGII